MVQLRIYVSFRKAIKRLTYAEKGMLLDAMLAYAEDKSLLPLEGRADAIWDFVQEMLDAQHKAYANKCESIAKARERSAEISMKSDVNSMISDDNSMRTGEDNLTYLKNQIQIQNQIQDKKSNSKEKKTHSRKRDYKERSVTDDDFKDLFLPLDEEIKK